MIIGVPKEIKPNEHRVAITPAGVKSLVERGHDVLIEKEAGKGSGFRDGDYLLQGAKLVSVDEVWQADLVMKVKEPIAEEYPYLRADLILYTFLHLASTEALTLQLLNKKVTAIAYETIQLEHGALPVLAPMSEIAGRMAVQIGARLLEKQNGGKGVLLGGATGVAAGRVVILGGGIVGAQAAKMALGLGAHVSLFDISLERLRYLEDTLHGRFQTLYSNSFHIAEALKEADLLIGAVLIPGARAPRLVSEEMVKTMTPGAVIVDVAIDQGGSIATVDRVTSHEQPTYIKHDVIHYSVANMPGAVPQTSTWALTNQTLPYLNLIADQGLEKALKENVALKKGVNTYQGHLTNKGVAEAHNLNYTDLMNANTAI